MPIIEDCLDYFRYRTQNRSLVSFLRLTQLSAVILTFVLVCAFACGCSDSRSPHVVSGVVKVGDEKVETGRIFFVPIEGTDGPRNRGRIANGEYRVDDRGGMLPGKYRVELDALKKTGRKKATTLGGERTETEETVPIAPPIYRGSDSPLIIEIPASSFDGHLDISVPGA